MKDRMVEAIPRLDPVAAGPLEEVKVSMEVIVEGLKKGLGKEEHASAL